MIRELYEIPETDENEKNQNFAKVDYCNSDGAEAGGPNNSYNR